MVYSRFYNYHKVMRLPKQILSTNCHQSYSLEAPAVINGHFHQVFSHGGTGTDGSKWSVDPGETGTNINKYHYLSSVSLGLFQPQRLVYSELPTSALRMTLLLKTRAGQKPSSQHLLTSQMERSWWPTLQSLVLEDPAFLCHDVWTL